MSGWESYFRQWIPATARFVFFSQESKRSLARTVQSFEVRVPHCDSFAMKNVENGIGPIGPPGTELARRERSLELAIGVEKVLARTRAGSRSVPPTVLRVGGKPAGSSAPGSRVASKTVAKTQSAKHPINGAISSSEAGYAVTKCAGPTQDCGYVMIQGICPPLFLLPPPPSPPPPLPPSSPPPGSLPPTSPPDSCTHLSGIFDFVPTTCWRTATSTVVSDRAPKSRKTASERRSLCEASCQKTSALPEGRSGGAGVVAANRDVRAHRDAHRDSYRRRRQQVQCAGTTSLTTFEFWLHQDPKLNAGVLAVMGGEGRYIVCGATRTTPYVIGVCKDLVSHVTWRGAHVTGMCTYVIAVCKSQGSRVRNTQH